MISNALRTAKPLPQLTPVLLELFSRTEVGRQEAARSVDAEDPLLPRMLTLRTLEIEQYMWVALFWKTFQKLMVVCRYFCVGVFFR